MPAVLGLPLSSSALPQPMQPKASSTHPKRLAILVAAMSASIGLDRTSIPRSLATG
jgi:hypothetical protein